MEYKLCFIDSELGCAFFTKNEIKDQWGDDWDDVPYEHNAGYPYEDIPGDIKKLYFELPTFYKTPCYGYLNSPYSVKDINNGIIAWLWNDDFKIFAGTTIEDFINIIEKDDGYVYLKKEK